MREPAVPGLHLVAGSGPHDEVERDDARAVVGDGEDAQAIVERALVHLEGEDVRRLSGRGRPLRGRRGQQKGEQRYGRDIRESHRVSSGDRGSAGFGLYDQLEAVHLADAQPLPLADRRPARRMRLPQLPPDADEPAGRQIRHGDGGFSNHALRRRF